MNRIELEQGSLGWHEWRFAHRNASEAATVMGCNPWQTKWQLFEQKQKGVIEKANWAMQHGNNLEEAARQKMSEILGVDLEPAVFHDGDWSASLDGYAEKDGKSWKVEIKCPFSGKEGSTWGALQEENPRIEDHYKWQIVHQSIVCPTDFTYFFVFVDEDTWDFTMFTPTDEDIAALKAAWEDFEANPPEPDYIQRTDSEFEAMVNTHRALTGQRKAIDTNLKAIEGSIKESCDMRNTEGFGTKVTVVERKGNVQYKKVPELEGIDLDQFRGKSSQYLRITHPKEAS